MWVQHACRASHSAKQGAPYMVVAMLGVTECLRMYQAMPLDISAASGCCPDIIGSLDGLSPELVVKMVVQPSGSGPPLSPAGVQP